jgi:REP element-mobilizing transposase RayT
MADKFDPQGHHRRSIRLAGFDYTQPGAYFVTLVAYQREELFGKIIEDDIVLSPLGEIVKYEWDRSRNIRQELCLIENEFIIMPNHIHGIIHLVEADGVRPGNVDGVHPDEAMGAHRAPLRREGRSLGSFIAGYKSSVTSRARRELMLESIWQRNYYEHIIRNDAEYARIVAYIHSNLQCWEEDRFFPIVSQNPH